MESMPLSALPQPPAGYVNPLSEEYLQLIDQGIQAAQQQIYRCQQAGMCELPGDQYLADAQRMLKFFQLLRQHYFPNHHQIGA